MRGKSHRLSALVLNGRRNRDYLSLCALWLCGEIAFFSVNIAPDSVVSTGYQSKNR